RLFVSKDPHLYRVTALNLSGCHMRRFRFGLHLVSDVLVFVSQRGKRAIGTPASNLSKGSISYVSTSSSKHRTAMPDTRRGTFKILSFKAPSAQRGRTQQY
ncbi:hypothetical protein CLAIMM_02455, partial [Cladophialophora immunda]